MVGLTAFLTKAIFSASTNVRKSQIRSLSVAQDAWAFLSELPIQFPRGRGQCFDLTSKSYCERSAEENKRRQVCCERKWRKHVTLTHDTQI